MKALIPKTMDLILTLLTSLPLLCVMQSRVFQNVTGRDMKDIIFSTQFLFTTCLLLVLISVSLPLVQFLLVALGLSAESPFIMRDLLRMSVALSSIPASMAGMAVVFHPESSRAKEVSNALLFLDGNDFSSLRDKTDAELHSVIEMALEQKRIEAADKISRHLLRRTESSGGIDSAP